MRVLGPCAFDLPALLGLRAAGLAGGCPRGGVACPRCEGRLVSGAVPLPAARPLGRAAGVPRPVCPGCSWCGRGDPAPARQRAPLRAGVARFWGGGRASPGGVPFVIVRGVWGQALPLPRLPALWAGCRGPLTTCCERGCADVGAQHCRLGLHALWGCVPWGWWGPSPGGVACHRCEGRLVSGAIPPLAARPLGRAVGLPQPVCPGCGWCGRGERALAPQHASLRAGVARCGGGGRASPGGDAFRRCEGRPRSGAPPPPAARPPGGLLGSTTHALWARVCGCGGPALSPWLACPVGAACRGSAGGPSPGGGACHRCEGRLVSGAVPPPAARPLGQAARVPRPVCPGCVWCGRADPAPAPQRAPLQAGVARCGGRGRASPGGVPFAVVRGV